MEQMSNADLLLAPHPEEQSYFQDPSQVSFLRPTAHFVARRYLG